VVVEVKFIFGDASYTIVEEANNEKCDLIIIGSRGLSGIQKQTDGKRQ